MATLLGVVVSVAVAGVWIWAAVDAGRHDRQKWHIVGVNRTLAILLLVVFGVLAAIPYLAFVRPRLGRPPTPGSKAAARAAEPLRPPRAFPPIALHVLRVLAPLAAVAFALAVSAVVLEVSGNDWDNAFEAMWDFGTKDSSIASIIDRSVPLYLSGVAFAIASKMGLFNIGVEGQYTIAALFAAYVSATIDLPPVIHISLTIAVAMAVGTLWAGIAGVIKVTRGVHEVISTIMLNFMATSLISYLLANHFLDRADTTLNLQTEKIEESKWFPTLFEMGDTNASVNAFVLVAIAVGVLYYLVIWRTRFGFDLRASGLNPFAAQASGVPAGPMVVKGMLLSGAVAGLVGMPDLLGFSHNYGLTFTTGLGFTGITVALLGRNNPLGIALGALLLAFLDKSSQILDLEGVAKEIVVIMEGVIVLSVVIAYEMVRRFIEKQQQLVGDEPPALEADDVPAPEPSGPASAGAKA